MAPFDAYVSLLFIKNLKQAIIQFKMRGNSFQFEEIVMLMMMVDDDDDGECKCTLCANTKIQGISGLKHKIWAFDFSC